MDNFIPLPYNERPPSKSVLSRCLKHLKRVEQVLYQGYRIPSLVFQLKNAPDPAIPTGTIPSKIYPRPSVRMEIVSSRPVYKANPPLEPTNYLSFTPPTGPILPTYRYSCPPSYRAGRYITSESQWCLHPDLELIPHRKMAHLNRGDALWFVVLFSLAYPT